MVRMARSPDHPLSTTLIDYRLASGQLAKIRHPSGYLDKTSTMSPLSKRQMLGWGGSVLLSLGSFNRQP